MSFSSYVLLLFCHSHLTGTSVSSPAFLSFSLVVLLLSFHYHRFFLLFLPSQNMFSCFPVILITCSPALLSISSKGLLITCSNCFPVFLVTGSPALLSFYSHVLLLSCPSYHIFSCSHVLILLCSFALLSTFPTDLLLSFFPFITYLLIIIYSDVLLNCPLSLPFRLFCCPLSLLLSSSRFLLPFCPLSLLFSFSSVLLLSCPRSLLFSCSPVLIPSVLLLSCPLLLLSPALLSFSLMLSSYHARGSHFLLFFLPFFPLFSFLRSLVLILLCFPAFLSCFATCLLLSVRHRFYFPAIMPFFFFVLLLFCCPPVFLSV
jgi:hypothetical protein